MELRDIEIRELMRGVYRAAMKSTDRSTNIGAMLVDEASAYNMRPLVLGYNAHLPGWGNKEEHHERPLKYRVTEHAERDVIYRAAFYGVRTQGLTMIANWVACPDCARGVVLAGIKRVVCHKQCMDKTPSRWKEMVDLGLEIFEKNNVPVYQWDGKVGGVTNLNNGKVWKP